MAKGPTPQDAPARRNNAGDRRNIAADARANNIPLLPGKDGYTEQTLTWYETWATSPQASTFTATEWQRLHMLAAIVDKFWLDPSQQLMAEIRQNEAKLGATLEDRVRMRMKIDPPVDPDAQPEAVAAPSRTRKDPRKR